MLSKEEFLSTQDFDVESVEIPEMGGDVGIRPLTTHQALELAGLEDDGKKMLAMQKAVAYSVCDENGERLFRDQDHNAIAQKSFSVVYKLATKIFDISGMGDDDDLEDLEKNSGTPGNGATS